MLVWEVLSSLGLFSVLVLLKLCKVSHSSLSALEVCSVSSFEGGNLNSVLAMLNLECFELEKAFWLAEFNCSFSNFKAAANVRILQKARGDA